MRETIFSMKPVVDGLKIKGKDGARTYLSLVKERSMQMLEAVACFLPKAGLHIVLDKLLKMDKRASPRILCLNLW